MPTSFLVAFGPGGLQLQDSGGLPTGKAAQPETDRLLELVKSVPRFRPEFRSNALAEGSQDPRFTVRDRNERPRVGGTDARSEVLVGP